MFFDQMAQNTRFKVWILLAGLLPEAIIDSTLTPLYPFIVRQVIPGEEEVGYYAGLLGSAFYLPLFLMNLVWGALSDKVGRKPILLISIFICFLTTLVLGFSQSFGLTLSCRLLAGLFGASSTVAKGMIGDIARDQRDRAWAYAMYGSVYGLSGLLGPIIGGVLTDPVKNYPYWFSKDGMFSKYPFLLITTLGCILSVIAFFLVAVHLSEAKEEIYEEITDLEEEDISDIPRRERSHFDIQIEREANESSPGRIALRRKEYLSSTLSSSSQQLESSQSLASASSSPPNIPFRFVTWNTLGPIFLYCTIAYTHMTYMTALPLFYSAPKVDGGMGLNARDTALSFSIIAGSKLFVQFFLFDKALLYFGGSKNTFRIGMMLYLPGHFLIPLLVYTSGIFEFLLTFMIMASFGTSESFGYLSVILLITESQLPQHLGVAHGLASTLAALARTLSPTISGSIWELGVALHWPWLVFMVGGGIAILGSISV
jgi:MFS family permease